jgi:hypothetical protein
MMDFSDLKVSELLDKIDAMVKDDKDMDGDYTDAIEELGTRWPFNQFDEFREVIKALKDENEKLRRHVHVSDGTIAILI